MLAIPGINVVSAADHASSMIRRGNKRLRNALISVLARSGNPRFSAVQSRLRAVSLGPALLPVVAIAEIEFGMAKAENPDPHQQAAMRAFFANWRMYARKQGRRHAERRPEELKDRLTGKELGIDERDLLIAAIAAQYSLVLATLEQNEGMRRIEAAAGELAQAGSPITLRISYWT